MNIAHKQLEACGYTNETFNLDHQIKSEVSFSPIVLVFLPDRSKRESIVEVMVKIIDEYFEQYCECCENEYQSIFHFEFDNESFVFEFAFDHINQKQLFILDVDGSRSFGSGINDTIH